MILNYNFRFERENRSYYPYHHQKLTFQKMPLELHSSYASINEDMYNFRFGLYEKFLINHDFRFECANRIYYLYHYQKLI